MVSVTHSTVVVVPDDGTSPVGTDEWNAAHSSSMATSRILGRVTAGTGTIEELTGTQTTAMLDAVTSSLKGLAPASGGGTTNFLRADATWAAPPGGGGGLPLVGTGSTYTTNTPLLDLSQTWNAGGVTFQAIKLNVTNTASAAASLLMDLQVGSTSQFSINESGQVVVDPVGTGGLGSPSLRFKPSAQGFWSAAGTVLRLDPGGNSSSHLIQFGYDGTSATSYISSDTYYIGYVTGDVLIARDAAGILAQRNSTNAQTLRIYNTYTDASNYARVTYDSARPVVMEKLGTGAFPAVTTSSPLLDLQQTWNAGAVTFTGIKLNVTDTASAIGSPLFDVQSTGNSLFNIQRWSVSGTKYDRANAVLAPYSVISSGGYMYFSPSDASGDTRSVAMGVDGAITIYGTTGLAFNSNADTAAGTTDIYLRRDAAGILAQRNSTNAQTLRVYNTYTDASNYERAVIDWTTTANQLTIGTQNLGTGSARSLMLVSASGLIQNHESLVDGSGSGIHSLGANGGGMGGLALASNRGVGWTNSLFASYGVGLDTGVSRSAAGVIALGNGSQGDGSATILAKTKAGAPTTSDVPAGTWALIRDTSGATTKLYYNNAGTLMTVALT